MKYFLGLILLINSYVFAQCPAETDLVQVELAQFEKKISFCQKNLNGVSTKHGPYIEVKLNEELIKKEYYLNGLVVSEETYLKSQNPQNEIDPEELNKQILDAHKAISSVLQSLSRVFQNDLRFEGFEYRGCKDYLMKWINVLSSDQAYQFSYEFKDKCDIEGNFNTHQGKKLTGNLNLRNLGIFNRLNFSSYYQVGSMANMEISIDLKDGELSSPKGKIIFDFNGKIYFNKRNLEFTQNKEGSLITFKKVFEMKVSIEKPFYALVEAKKRDEKK